MSGRRIVDIINMSSSAWTLLRCRVLAMRAAGYDNRILCMDGPHVERLRAEGIPVHVVPLPRGIRPLLVLRSFFAIHSYLRREKVELVHTHCSIPGVVGRLAAWCAGVPVIVHTVHGFHFHDHSRGPRAALFVAIERLCAWPTSMLLMQNRSDVQRAERLRIGRAERRRHIGNGIDVERFVPAGHAAEANGRVRVTCVARLEPVKNHELLLRATALLRQRGVRFQLRLAGEGPLQAHLAERCRELGIADDVEFLGYRDDVPALLADSDIAVLTSLKEGMPRAVLEAMAMGLPVVATRVTGTREAVEHGRTGLLVEPTADRKLACALEEMIENPRLRGRMGAEGRMMAERVYDERAIIDSLRRTYDELLGRRAPLAVPAARNGHVAPAGTGTRPNGDVPSPAHAAHGETGDARLRVGRNAAFRIGAQAISGVINLAGMILLGNALGASGYGRYVWYYAMIPLVASLADGGVNIIIMRRTARNLAAGPRWLGDALLVRGVVGAVMLAVGAAVLGGLGQSHHTGLLAIVLVTALLDPSQDVALWAIRAHERLDLEAALLLLSQGLWLALIAAGVALHVSLEWMLLAATIAFGTRLVVATSIVRRMFYAPRFSLRAARLRWLVGQGLPFGFAVLSAVLYGRIGVVLLHTFANAAQVGQFQVAYLLTQPFGFVASAVSVAAFPLLARRADRNDGAFGRALRQAVRWQLFITLPLTAALIVLAHPLVTTLFHEHHDFDATASAIQLMAPGLTVIFLNLTARYALPALGRQRRYLHATLAGLATNVLAGLVLIPRFGVAGAVGAFLTAELVILIVCQRALASHLRWADLVHDAWRPLVAAVVMGAGVAWLRHQPLVLVVPAGVALYVLALWLTGAVSASERRMIGRLVATTGPWHHQPERRSVA